MWFQVDGAPTHFSQCVHRYLNATIPMSGQDEEGQLHGQIHSRTSILLIFLGLGDLIWLQGSLSQLVIFVTCQIRLYEFVSQYFGFVVMEELEDLMMSFEHLM